MKKEKLFAVFGLGKFGLEVCKVIAEKGKEVIAIDRDPRLIAKVKNIVTQAIVLDSTDTEALQGAGLQDVDIAVVAIRESIDASILTTILLKNIGVPYIIARSMSDIHGQVLRQVGAAEVLNLEIQAAQRLANRISSPNMKDIIPISDNQSLAELRVSQGFVGKTLHELEIRKKCNVNIITVKRTKTTIDRMGNPEREELAFSPKPMDILEINDILVVLGNEKDIDQLKEMMK